MKTFGEFSRVYKWVSIPRKTKSPLITHFYLYRGYSVELKLSPPKSVSLPNLSLTSVSNTSSSFMPHSCSHQRNMRNIKERGGGVWNWEGPCRALQGTKVPVCPLRLVCSKRIESSRLSRVAKSTLKQLLIREEMGCRDKRKAVK